MIVIKDGEVINVLYIGQGSIHLGVVEEFCLRKYLHIYKPLKIFYATVETHIRLIRFNQRSGHKFSLLPNEN